MPRRVIDGDSLWVSEKLSEVEEEHRAEYAWILPMSQGNGCFECSPMLVWRTCYAALRPSWSVDKVKAMLNDFERVKMLFRFKRDAKTYGFFPGIQKDGRLPKPSDRLKSAKQWQKGMVPRKELMEFLGVTSEWMEQEYGGGRDVLATYSQKPRPHDDADGDVADDVNVADDANVKEDEYVKASASALDNVGSAATSASKMSMSKSSSSPSEKDGSNKTSNSKDKPLGSVPSPDTLSPATLSMKARKFAGQMYDLSFSNPHVDRDKVPSKWETLWMDDFKAMLESYSVEDVKDILVWTQLPDQQQYNVRTESIRKNAKMYLENAHRLKKDAKKWQSASNNFLSNLMGGKHDREKHEKGDDDD